MANSLARFSKIAIGSKSRDSDFIPRINSTGDLARVTGIQAILASWNNILITPRRSVSFDPEFGSDLARLIFEPADSSTVGRVREEVHYRLMTYDNRAKIVSLNVAYLKNRKGFNVTLTAEYKGEKAELSAIIDESIYFNFLKNA